MRNALPITDTDSLKRLYDETVDLFGECGGSYRVIPESTYLNILDALSHGRYVITRDGGGKIQRALFYWMIQPEDVEAVKHGLPPSDKDGGKVCYICEHAGADGAKGLKAAVRTLKDRYGGASVCWHDRYVRPDRFRLFRRTPA
jgi:hypothetical protein